MNTENISITKYDLLFESRLTRVESAMENFSISVKILSDELRETRKDMKADFRWMIAMMIGLVTIMAKGFHWI